MADLSPLISFTAGTPAVADEVNQNFAAIRAHVNGANVATKNIDSTLLSRTGGPILNLTQLTENQIAFNVENSQSNTAVSIAQLAALAAGKSILKLSETVAQTQGDAQLFLSLQTSSTIPAILIKHGATETFKVTKDTVRPPIKTTSQRNSIASPDEGSVIYNSTTKQLNEKKANTWAPVGSPVGSVQMFAGESAPEGWLLCNGDIIPNGSGTVQTITADYSALYNVVGSLYGSAGKLPDCRGIFVRGVGAQTIGAETYTGVLGTSQNDATAKNGLSLTDPGHNHTLAHGNAFRSHGGELQPRFDAGYEVQQPNNAIQSKTTGITLNDGDSETRPANIAMNYIIKY